jgi:hypothetical protein
MLSSTGLSPDPEEYRRRLDAQEDEQVDAWAVELLRDLSIRRGVLTALEKFRRATGLDDTGLERVFSAGGGPPAVLGRTADGRLMVPAISLRHLVPGLRRESTEARPQLVDFLVESFHEIVYI